MDRQLSALARHMEWADAAVWNAARGANGLHDGALTDLLHHMHLVQHIFCQSWSGGPFNVRERAYFEDVEQLAIWGRSAHVRIQVFLAAADSDDLDRELRLPWAKQFEERSQRDAQPHTVGESMLQVALHTAHHRGQVCRRIRECGGEPPVIDFIVWLWAGRPPADWA